MSNFTVYFRQKLTLILTVTFHCCLKCQVVARGLVERKTGGSIVNIASQAALKAIDEHTVYCASKAAMVQVTQVMALELGKHNVRRPSLVFCGGQKLHGCNMKSFTESLLVQLHGKHRRSSLDYGNNYLAPYLKVIKAKKAMAFSGVQNLGI